MASIINYRFHVFRVLMIYISFFFCSVYPFLHYKAFECINDIVNLNYFVAIFTLLSINPLEIGKFKTILLLILPICLIFRNWLMLWTVIATAYQLIELKIPIRNLAITAFLITLFQLLFQIELILLGITSHTPTIVEKTHSVIYDLGLGNSNNVGTTIFYLISLLYLICFKHHRTLFVISSITIDLLMYYYCGSRTFFLSSLILIFFGLIYFNGLLKRYYRFYIALLPTVFVSLIVYIAIQYEYLDVEFINEIVSGRLYLFYLFFRDFTIIDFLLGKPLELDVPLDNAYLAMLHLGGIITLSFFCICCYKAIMSSFNEIKAYIPFIIGMLFAAMAESTFGAPSGAGIILWMIILTAIIPQKYTFQTLNES